MKVGIHLTNFASLLMRKLKTLNRPHLCFRTFEQLVCKLGNTMFSHPVGLARLGQSPLGREGQGQA